MILTVPLPRHRALLLGASGFPRAMVHFALSAGWDYDGFFCLRLQAWWWTLEAKLLRRGAAQLDLPLHGVTS